MSAAEPTKDDGWPPERFFEDRSLTVAFKGDPNELCGFPVEPGWRLLGCHMRDFWGSRLVLPNPCTWGEYKDEDYARLVCHELGHANGWTGDHPRP